MTIAVLSGKGGTGKTLVSVNLAAVADEVLYLDCDVEAPNGHLFFKHEVTNRYEVTVKIPVVNQDQCTGCRTCVDFCHYNALAYVGEQVKVFENICHSCGGCELLCEAKAITEFDKVIGYINEGQTNQVRLLSGILNIGEVSGIPIINKLLQQGINKNLTEETVIIDCPPGSACSVMESIKEADYCVLVGEPSIFGAHNLEMVHELVTKFKKPFGVILNKDTGGFNASKVYCDKGGLPIIGKIPFDQRLGGMNAVGKVVAWEEPSYEHMFKTILNTIKEVMIDEAIVSA